MPERSHPSGRLPFTQPVTFASAGVTPGAGGTATIDSTEISGNEVRVNLSNVSNAQILNVSLLGVNDGTNTRDLAIPVGILAGDVTADGAVNSADITATRRQSGTIPSAGPPPNFRTDVSFDGVTNSADITVVRRQSGTAIP